MKKRSQKRTQVKSGIGLATAIAISSALHGVAGGMIYKAFRNNRNR